MRAVNLIPSEQRGTKRSLSTGLPFIGLVAGLLIVLVAAALFVLAHNRVDSRRTELAAVKTEAARWSAAAATYSRDVSEAKSRETTIGSVISLAGQRVDWSELLGQLATVMPAQSRIGSLTAAAPTTTAAASATTTTPAASSTSTTAPASTAASTTSAASTNAGSTIQLTGCASSQSVVAKTMVALRRVTGISHVYLSSSSGGSGGSGGSGSSGGCSYPVNYTVSLAFDPPMPAASTTTTGQLADDTSSTSGSSGASQ